jgi:hypothetical protein
MVNNSSDRPSIINDEGEVQKPGKFWVYEQIIRIPYYGIYEISNNRLEVDHLRDLYGKKIAPNQRGHSPIEP